MLSGRLMGGLANGPAGKLASLSVAKVLGVAKIRVLRCCDARNCWWPTAISCLTCLEEASQDAFDSAVRAKGERILASGRQNVTSLQARAGMMDERGARTYWRGLVRPIPNVASPAAQLGTQFHAWAERFIMADANDAGIGVGASGNDGTRVAESRLAMLAELRRNNAAQSQDNQDDNGADNNGIFDWQQRLATSTWARRKPAWAERQIVVNVPQLGTIVNGKLDAVFFGGLDGADRSKQYTIVD